MVRPTLNIGLAVNDGSTLRPEHALAAAKAIGGARAIAARVHQSDSEPTLVIETAAPITAAAAYELARYLQQDAVAQWDGYQGDLYGPAADAWGAFNPAYFLTLDGSRLAA